jgi:hypothetical protein
MHDSERNKLVNDLRRFRLAQSDMQQVVAAATHLASEHLNGDLCRALETAIVICYARPFDGRNAVGRLGDEFVPTDAVPRRIHQELLRLRDKVYAHTDRTDARDVVDLGQEFDLQSPLYAEQWRPLDRRVLAGIIHLAVEVEGRLREAAAEREAKLAAKLSDVTGL